MLIEPIYEKWLEIAMLRGDITFDISGKALPFDKRPKFAAASRFQGRRWSWVDPSKEVDASQKQVDLGINSRTNIAAAQGREFDDILDELKAEQNAMDAAGIRPKAPAAAAPQQPGTPGDPQ